MDTSVLNFMSPPIPYFIGCGKLHYGVGERHINRYHAGIFDVVVIVKGKLYLGEEDKKWELGENEALIVRPDLYHYGYAECTEETELLWVHFQTVGVWAEHESIQEYLQKQSQLKDQHRVYGIPASLINPISVPKHTVLSQKALDYIKELVQLQDEPRSIAAWKQQTVFQQFLQYMDCQQSVKQDLTAVQVAEKVQKFIHRHYQQRITNAVLQQEMNFHPNYIAKCMRKHFGITPLEYLNQFRLEKSKKLLLNTGYSIEKIAEEVGMELSAFSNSFRSKEDVSPSHYRKKYMRSV